ncbi:hypothetical protein GEV33_013219 [Tenebrio molitor]|uniref:Uncharacterized protein n=1 Tax=Tenebrio molitor TaxID=7067 RepID=A0A8J6L7J1_TENMO|nr:hypothetical protein GEV33_013219 [Tenebrio molitor]
MVLKLLTLETSYILYLNPPPPGGTAILPEYIHYYGYYYQNPSRRKRTRRSDKSWESGKDGKVHGCEEWLTERRSEVHEGPLETIRPGTTAPNRRTHQGLHCDRSPDRTLLWIKISSGPGSPGRTLFIHSFTVSAGSDLVSEHHNFMRRFFIGLIKFNDSSCRPAVNPEPGEGKGEELDILTLTGGRCNRLASEKGSAFHPLIFSRFAVNGVGRLLVGFASNREARGIISHLFVRDKPQSTIPVVRIVNRVEAHDLFVIPLNIPDL